MDKKELKAEVDRLWEKYLELQDARSKGELGGLEIGEFDYWLERAYRDWEVKQEELAEQEAREDV